MAQELPELEYAYDALEPHFDARTMEIHHDKHHAAYVANVNKALEGSPLAELPIEKLSKQARTAKVFNKLKTASLMSIGKLCDDGCEAKLTMDAALITKNDDIVMKGQRIRKNGM